MKKILIVLVCLLCFGCDSSKKVEQFKDEYEKYNNKYLSIELDNTDIIHYSSVSEINDLITKGTGVIYLGSPLDNLSRRAVSILMDVADNTGLKDIYYLNTLDGVNGLDDIQDKKLPLVLFVLDGKIQSYHIGTIQDKEELSEDETIELYNIYSDGVHVVLQDACDETC